MNKSTQFLSVAAIAASLLVSRTAQAQIIATIDAAGVQASQVAGVTTETFNGFSTGIPATPLVGAIGTYSPGFAIVAADQFGGAGGTGNYFSVGAQSGQTSSTLTLSAPASYFGMWYCAGDAKNMVELYDGSTLEYSLNTAGLLGLITGSATPYYGNPTANFLGDDSGEPFGYVNFQATGNTVITSVVFDNNGTGTGFESDNHSVVYATTPEPGAWALAITGCLSGAGFLRRRRAR